MYFDAGGGHRSAAMALEAVIKQQQRPWNVRLVHLQELLQPLDVFRKVTGINLEDIYNLMLAKGWTLGSAQGLQFMHGVIRMYHRKQVKLLAEHWSKTKPDIVVSLVPNFNRSMYEGLRQANPKTPYVTVLTDMADYPPHFWIEPDQDQWFVCGTTRAMAQVKEMGHPEDRAIRTSGMILRPKFYDPITIDRAAERRRLGLQPNLPTGVVLFGGQGSKVMLEIARRVSDSGHKVQLIFICGKNEELAAKLRGLKLEIPFHVVGYTSEVPSFMYISDFLIGKPGPGSISEAIQMGIPVIIERNLFTLPQERFNADWVIENQVGVVLKNFGGVGTAVGQLLAPGVLDKYKRNAVAIQNRAVFEIPDILANIANI
jgi:1,2-diacylglycerol 3-beta-galactosyltransferase